MNSNNWKVLIPKNLIKSKKKYRFIQINFYHANDMLIIISLC